MNVRITAQRGAAMLVMVALIAMGASWMLLTSLNSATNRNAADRAQNARIMAEAKLALIAWTAATALESGEYNPGRLPCPEAAGSIGTSNEGEAAGNCTLPAVGRLPWRTLGVPKMLDAAGEPLWYAVGADWANYSASASLIINSNTQGTLTVDSLANGAVALIIAPGPPLGVSASTNCTARAQQRSATPPDLRDYLECQNASSPADATFATSGPSGSFNDQVLRVTTSDVMPAIEASIAKRIERDIVPALKSVAYSGSTWGLSTTSTDVVYPYAAPFLDPVDATKQNPYFAGTPNTYQGLLPFNYTATSCSSEDYRCNSAPVSYGNPIVTKTGGSASLWPTVNCYFYATYSYCQGWYQGGNISLQMGERVSNVAMGFRQISLPTPTSEVSAYDYDTYTWTTPSSTNSRVFDGSNGSVDLFVNATFPSASGWGLFYIYNYQRVSDHNLLDAANVTTGWFVRNEWYKLVYYALAPSQAASGASPRNCQDAVANCLVVSGVAGSNKRAMLILAGRSLTHASRPNNNLADFLDSAENRNGDTTFLQDKVGPASNDRMVLVDASP